MRLLGTGNLGVGCIPAAKLHIRGSGLGIYGGLLIDNVDAAGQWGIATGRDNKLYLMASGGAQIVFDPATGEMTGELRKWGGSFVFGDGSTVILAQEMGIGPFPVACKITEVKIREQALISSTATITLHIHDYNAAIGDAVDSFGLSGASYSEIGLNWPVAAGKFITVKIASPTSAKQLSIGLVFEAT
jgi:hypothetical protein